MKAKERDEIIIVFEDAIKYLKQHLHIPCYLCNILSKHLLKYPAGGYNSRMLPQALKYFESQKPTVRLNSKCYHTPHYNNSKFNKDTVIWWNNSDGPMGANLERIKFLEHLILKLKK